MSQRHIAMARKLLFAILVFMFLIAGCAKPVETPVPPLPDPFPRSTDVFISGMAGPNCPKPFEQADFISQSHATIIGVGADRAFRADSAYEKRYRTNIATAHKAGLRWTIWLSVNDAQDIDLKTRPDLLEATCIDIDGNKIKWGPTDLYWQCTNNPIWREDLVEVAKRSIDWGADGIAIDEWPGTSDSLHEPYNGCFCEHCMRGFREYLKKKYSLDELTSFGIEDIDSLDYGRFIREKYLAQYRSDRWETPLFLDFQGYQMRNITDFWHEFIIELKEHAGAQGKRVYFSANTA